MPYINERARYLLNKEVKKTEHSLKKHFRLLPIEARRLLECLLDGKAGYPILATIPDTLIEEGLKFLGDKVADLKTLRENAKA